MKSTSSRILLGLLAFLSLATTLQAQVSFFQPPTYTGTGNVFLADFNGDGNPDLLTGDGTLNLGNGDGTFKQGMPVAGTPLAVADFNGDGKPDVLEQGTGTLLVLLGNGDGTFQQPISTASGASLYPLTAVDVNGDGKADAIGIFNNMVIVYLSKADGTFAPGVSYNLGTSPPGASVITFGDFNGDNIIDIAVSAFGNNVLGQEIVLLGNGNGTFQAAKSSTGIYYPAYATVGDFNGDGKADLAVSAPEYCNGSCTVPASVYIFLGNGDGTFQAPTAAIPGNGPLAALDLNGDGKVDLVLEVNPTVGQIYLGNGDSTFSDFDNYVLNFPPSGTTSGFTGIATADFNHDGKVDIAMGNAVLLGNANGTFQGIHLGLVPGFITASVVGVFDNGKAPGVAVVSNQNVYILQNNGSGQLSLLHTYPLQGPGLGIAAADLNGDGNLDLLVVGTSQTLSWAYNVLLGNGDGSFQLPVFYPQSVQSQPDNFSIIVADFNGDKKPDLAIGLGQYQSFALLIGNGDGTFAAPTYVYDGNASILVSADFNGDGKLDIAARQSQTAPIGTALLFGNGDGTFQDAIFPANLTGFTVKFTADFNNDGRPDLMADDQVALGNGDGTFTLKPPINYLVNQVGDLNGDGIPDLLVALSASHSSQSGMLLGNGDGTFGPDSNLPQNGWLPFGALIADMNGDGRPDIVFPWHSAVSGSGPSFDGVGIMLNTSPPNFKIAASAFLPASVTAGNSAASNVSVSRTFGFSETVTLTCVGLPNGATCQFNPPAVASGSSASSLTITTTASAAAGTYPVQVQGSAGSLTSSATLTLVVQAAPDFAVSVSTTTQTVSAGQAASFGVAITPLASFVGTVNLTCGITPAVTPAPTCTLSNSSVQMTASGAQSVTVTVGTTAPMTTGGMAYFQFRPLSIPMTFVVMLLGLGWLLRWNRKYRPVMAALVIIVTLSLCVGCGGGSSSHSHTAPGTPAGTYTVTITATSVSLNHNTTSQVIVQ